MAQNIDFATYEGHFKHRYEDKLTRVIPAFTDCQKEIKFNPRKRQGDKYIVPLALQLEAGITWALQSDGAFALNLPIAGISKQAEVSASCTCLRSSIAYVGAFSGEDQEQAFENVTGSAVKNSYEALRRFLEADILYGQDDAGIGIVEDIAGAGVPVVPANSIRITAATWAPGLWVQGAKVEVYAADHSAVRNAATPTITAVDYDLRNITFDALPAAAVATDVIHYYTAFSGAGGAHKTMAGLKKIISNVGTLFNINAAIYTQWRGNLYDCGAAAFSFPKLGRGAAKILAKGGQGNEFILWVSGDTWQDLNSDVDALRADDTSGYKPGKIELGHQFIRYHTVVGPVDIRAHAMIKGSEAIMIPKGSFDRVGSTDITFDRSKMTGLKAGDSSFLREMESNAGFEFRGFSHQAIFTERPGYCVFFYNIVNNTV